MPGWSRTVKPIADMTLANAALLPDSNLKANADVVFPNVVGADRNEVAAVAGIAQPGWVVVRDRGNGRKTYETLVAMKNPPVETADDAILPDAGIKITTQPQTVSITANAATSFTVVATSNPTVTLSYQWQVSSNAGVTYTNVSNGGVYANATTATLSLANTVGLAGTLYRVVVANALANASVTSGAANVIFV